MRRIFFFVALLSLFVIINSCKKETDFGIELQPQGDKLSAIFTDTVLIESSTHRPDSINTSGITMVVLGQYNDPVFGVTKSDFFAQFNTGSTGITFSDSPVADSMVIYLDYSGFYGKENGPFKLKVFELKDTINKGSDYYSNLDVNPYVDFTTPVAEKQFTVNESSFPRVDFIDSVDYISNSLNITMANNDLANKILNADGAFLLNTTVFNQYVFKGLFFTIDTASGLDIESMLYFNVTSNKSRAIIYYHDNTGSDKKFSLYFSSKSARFIHVDHDYSNTVIDDQINNPASNDGSRYYIQSLAGVRGFLKFPNLDKWSIKDNIMVVDAKLILPVDYTESTYSEYTPPDYLYLASLNGNDTIEKIDDAYLSESYFDGSLYSSSGSYYKFHVTRYVQKVISGNITSQGLFVFPNNSKSVSATRVIMRGNNNSDPVKLLISYVKF